MVALVVERERREVSCVVVLGSESEERRGNLAVE
jgi:hypothetical protein